MGGMNGKASYASLCRKCMKCVELCPQSIPIPEKLEEVVKDMEHPLMRQGIKVAAQAVKGYTYIKRKIRGAIQK